MENLNTYRVFQEQKRRIFLALVLLLFAMFPTLKAMLFESRAYRDMAQLTAFHDVVLKSVVAETETSILISGSMIKRRCMFMDAVAYTTRDGASELARLEFNPYGSEPAVENRPAIDTPQGWGPWRIVTLMPNPVTFAVYTRHECPDEGRPQSNLFVRGEWPAPGAND